ncbi:major capsid protein [Microviridae sp.]|nr:major capsid protein [Microviridae sp.]
MNNIFKTVPMRKPKMNAFDLSHSVKFSLDMGQLVPHVAMKVVPGDVFHMSSENMLRFAPLVSPVMHRVNVSTHFFFVPNRILWADWEDWITGESEVTHPFFTLPVNGDVGSTMDYLGYPIEAAGALAADAFPVAAYIRIFNEYYRDQNLVAEVPGSELTAGANAATQAIAFTPPLNRAWSHDYFTSCLPWPQKGDAAILPLGAFSDVDVILDIQGTPNPGMRVRDANGDLMPTSSVSALNADGGAVDGLLIYGAAGLGPAFIDPSGHLKAETSVLMAEAADINTVRRAFRLQEWLEKDARGGTRYIENIYSHFGVMSSDKRLQRPEYIGGSRQRMVISEVLSTTETIDSGDATVNPVGALAGHGISVGGGKRFKYRAEEHGWIIGIINVQPVTAYQQGLHRTMSQFTREDYYWPSFANIGEQAVLKKEIYALTSDPDGTFGYIPRYSEFKFMNSRVAGDFRDTLDYWTLTRIFDTEPTLSGNFVTSDPSKRIFAVVNPDVNSIYAQSYINCKAIRPMPKFGVPTI